MIVIEPADAEPWLKRTTRLSEVEADVPDCPECARLFHQARAALLSGDRSRLSDVRIFQSQHQDADH